MSIIKIAPHLHSIQKWIEELEQRLANIDTDMTQLHRYELQLEQDVSKLSAQLQEVISNNKDALLLDVQNIRDTVVKLVHDVTGPVEAYKRDSNG